MSHPIEACNRYQAEFLSTLPEPRRIRHAYLFRVANASYTYFHLLRNTATPESNRRLWEEWLQALPPGLQNAARKQGMSEAAGIASYQRFVAEKNNAGLDAHLKKQLSPQDYRQYQQERRRN